ncbi:tetratricopeptide repeat protein [Nonomuraea sp. NPDC051941]|uniref:tetratricopeptide repeat protein n=1 Tax=Nonomuraea sp. NPDC051941 TaxID=3364373 RepID=UPI0037C6699C
MTLLQMVPPPEMVGRETHIQDMADRAEDALQAARPLLTSVIHGMAGVGKTALARAVASRVKDRFPHAFVEVDLYGFTPGNNPADPRDVLAELLVWAGFEVTSVPDSLDGRARMWRGWLAGQRVLLLLDNVRDVEQVLPLLPHDAPHCLTLITSRSSLDDLDQADRLLLDVLEESKAVDLLRLRADRPLTVDSTLKQLARLCGGLPLTLVPLGRLLVHQDPALVLEALMGAMREGEGRFRHTTKINRAVQAAFAISYGAVDHEQRRVLRCCAWHPGPDFDARSIAVMAEMSRPVAALRLNDLADQALLIRLPEGRYSFHDVFLEYARQQADAEDQTEIQAAGRDRLYEGLRHLVDAATSTLIRPGHDNPVFDSPTYAHSWLTAATSELCTATAIAVAHNRPAALPLGEKVTSWLCLNGRYLQAQTLFEAMVDSPLGHIDILKGLGDVSRLLGKHEQAEKLYLEAHFFYSFFGNEPHKSDVILAMGEIALMRRQYELAEGVFQQIHTAYRQIESRLGQANALSSLGEAKRMQGELNQAQDFYWQAYTLYEDIGSQLGQAYALKGSGEVALIRGEYGDAENSLRQADTLFKKAGHRLGQAHTMLSIGGLARMRGKFDQAEDIYLQTYTVYSDIGDQIGQAHTMLGLGELARMRGKLDQAEDIYLQAHTLYNKTNDRLGQAHARHGLAEVARMQEKYDKAGNAFRQAQTLYKEIGDRLGHANTAHGLGNIAEALGEYEQAGSAFKRARALYEEIGNPLGVASVFFSMAQLAKEQKHRDEACHAYAMSEAIFRTIGIDRWATHCQKEHKNLNCECTY